MNDDKRGALATETYVFECDEAVGSIIVEDVDRVLSLGARVTSFGTPQLSFVSTDGELRA